jgi:hypothetical protein
VLGFVPDGVARAIELLPTAARAAPFIVFRLTVQMLINVLIGAARAVQSLPFAPILANPMLNKTFGSYIVSKWLILRLI